MDLNLDEIEKALNEAESEDSTVKQVEYVYANFPEWLRLLMERVRKLERLEMAADYVKFYKDCAFNCIEAGNKKGFLSNIKHMQMCLTQLCEMIDNEE